MDDLRHRAAQVAVDLRSLQKRITQSAGQIADVATYDLLRELKLNVDSLRHLLAKVLEGSPFRKTEAADETRSLYEQVTDIVNRHTRSRSNAA